MAQLKKGNDPWLKVKSWEDYEWRLQRLKEEEKARQKEMNKRFFSLMGKRIS